MLILDKTLDELREIIHKIVLYQFSKVSLVFSEEQWKLDNRRMLTWIKEVVNQLQTLFFIDFDTRRKLKRSATFSSERFKTSVTFADEDITHKRTCDVKSCSLAPLNHIMLSDQFIDTDFTVKQGKAFKTDRERFLLHCDAHSQVCKVIYYLENMEYNIYRNCQHWITKIGSKKFEINGKIENAVIRGLVDYYIKLFIEVDSLDKVYLSAYRSTFSCIPTLKVIYENWVDYVKTVKSIRIRSILDNDKEFQKLKDKKFKTEYVDDGSDEDMDCI
ncbi:unnamed protein product [Bursaphelenchus okinawaensis]|uniref:Uncharacterized protein n=1 Tax=Bursaphelenchus okinawaensis TaxID=465554 RepID=A0A811K3W9_9BILA|nr:unnamed protein product [Bursaphelenchus okinawaensis]CAG9090840.1 unnamed protein product [Bursaphelenchus okinawaensis]